MEEDEDFKAELVDVDDELVVADESSDESDTDLLSFSSKESGNISDSLAESLLS